LACPWRQKTILSDNAISLSRYLQIQLVFLILASYYLAMPLPTTLIKAVGELYAADPAAKSVLDYFAFKRERRPRNSLTTIDQLVRDLNNAGLGISRIEAVVVLRKLDECGSGTYRATRNGNPPKFEWKYSAIQLARAVAAGSETDEKLRPEEADEEEESEADQRRGDSVASAPPVALEYTFPLRPGWEIRLTLPGDLTVIEAGRLSAFLNSLPYGAPKVS
jgi:hypothetical protein